MYSETSCSPPTTSGTIPKRNGNCTVRPFPWCRRKFTKSNSTTTCTRCAFQQETSITFWCRTRDRIPAGPVCPTGCCSAQAATGDGRRPPRKSPCHRSRRNAICTARRTFPGRQQVRRQALSPAPKSEGFRSKKMKLSLIFLTRFPQTAYFMSVYRRMQPLYGMPGPNSRCSGSLSAASNSAMPNWS